MTNTVKEFSVICPIPVRDYPNVLLAHGSGGRLMHQLIEKMFTTTFSHQSIKECHDSAVLNIPSSKLAFTTDSYVIHPLIFPGGDIGALAVNGTVNDLAMSGARPLYLSLGFIIEEGLPMETLWQITQSIKRAADAAGVKIVTGDTKVVDKGKGDGLFINTAGIGVIEHDLSICPASVVPGDSVVVNGDLARHGMAVMAVREGLEFESSIESDTAPLNGLVERMLSAGIKIHCLRDLTRGGLSSALNEIAASADVEIQIDESAVPIREDVSAACEILGLDPFYVANEGRCVAFVSPSEKEQILSIMKNDPLGQDARVIGEVKSKGKGLVTLKSKIGAYRILDMLSGEQLPRIC
jgi:hydrogenase expression/formation protein HypE